MQKLSTAASSFQMFTAWDTCLLVQLSTINPPPRFRYIKESDWVSGWWSISTREYRWPNPSFSVCVSVCLSFLHFFVVPVRSIPKPTDCPIFLQVVYTINLIEKHIKGHSPSDFQATNKWLFHHGQQPSLWLIPTRLCLSFIVYKTIKRSLYLISSLHHRSITLFSPLWWLHPCSS